MNMDMDYTLLKTGHGLVLCGSTELNNAVNCTNSIINPVQIASDNLIFMV